ncbi:MAG: hypothetical protein J1F65_01780 [Clostridiales bacterium]|nr:hypothetical protein [Clostridiales bacterium]
MQIAVSIACALCLTVASQECFRVLQSCSYRPQRGYFKILLSWYYLSLLVIQVVAALLYVFFDYYGYVCLVLYAAVAVFWSVFKRKCPLKLTKRVLRMFVAQFAVLAVLCVFVDLSFFVWLLPVVAIVSYFICLPIDLLIARHYIRRATTKLANSEVTVIAVTGSYGKTSVKDMLYALLKDSIAPTGSCNTPLGVASFVNKTDLTGVKYLVLEFGARKRGDIAELCALYKPKYGVVTGVCAQHLSTFKSLDNVIATKRELVEHLPDDGFCVLNSSDDYARAFADSGACKKYLSYDDLKLNVRKVGFDGTTLCVQTGGSSTEVRLPQISEYAQDTFAMCLQTVLRLGQSLDETLIRVGNVKQTPHRMELIKGAGCYVLDDSYNGSTVGVESCCKTLANFNCTKVVITQGLVECGKQAREMNIRCGQLLGEACDVAVVLGKNAKYLTEGLLATKCIILPAKDLKQAVGLATQRVNGGILLFQNDLPDVVNV